MKHTIKWKTGILALLGFFLLGVPAIIAAPLPGGTLDPLTIPKYVTPLVIPPVMPTDGATNSYDIAVRQFMQQILPAGFPATKVWSYGAAADPVPAVAPAAGSSFNYPAFTVETTSGSAVNVRWLNELVALDPATGRPYPVGNPSRTFLPHMFTIDQTLHWANPAGTGCADGTNRTDCNTLNPTPYTGPVPMVSHLHGAHVDDHSDGFPEAWWLPEASNLTGYVESGVMFGDANSDGVTPNAATAGYADYVYRNDQPATTLWYHDHTLGITRANVYAGPAGFWLVRGGTYDGANTSGGGAAVLPGPAPAPGEDVNGLTLTPVRNKIREIPVVIQDRSFNTDGLLFYPTSRAFFDGFTGPYIPTSDIPPFWNPEFFGNTMVVNGSTWPTLQVAPALYRLRLLNGCNSRFLNLSLFQIIKSTAMGTKQKDRAKLNGELPFYQIGAEQGFLPQTVMIHTGFATPLPGDGTIPATLAAAPDPMQALLLGPAERADVIVDFRGLMNGTRVRMLNTAPDMPFGGFPDVPADPSTSGQIMEFVVNARPASMGGPLGAGPTDPVLGDGITVNPNAATPPQNLVLNFEPSLVDQGGTVANTRQLSLNELSSNQVCVQITPSGRIRVLFTTTPNDPNFATTCAAQRGIPMVPEQALLGTFDATGPTGVTTAMMWHEAITETPTQGTEEVWEIFNLTVDGHPIHPHLVRFQVVDRQLLDPLTLLPSAAPGAISAPQPAERGYKDTVIALPGQVTRVRARFDLAGLYVWHCHILEHEDNEMMRPYRVVPAVP